MRKKATPAPLKLASLRTTIRRLRIAKRWSQAKLAERSSLSPKAVARIERGQGELRILTVVRIAKALETTTAKLMRNAKL